MGCTRDLHNNVKASRGISPAAATTDNTAYVSQIVDTNGFESCEFVGICGSIADADVTFTVLVEDGDNSTLTDNAAVDDAYLLGREAGTIAAARRTARAPRPASPTTTRFKIGYVGPKRYVRVTITPAANTGNIFIAGVWLQGHPRVGPQTSQVV
jgi:hypothetical protein